MVILGLGTNVGDRVEQLQQAVTALKSILSDVTYSPVYESRALLPDGAPREWDQPFLNMAVMGETALAPRALLNEVKTIERGLGRQVRGHWGPREIDIDILALGDNMVNEADLVIPHAALLLRDFALVPLADIAPFWLYPVPGESFGKTARELAVRFIPGLNKTEIVLA